MRVKAGKGAQDGDSVDDESLLSTSSNLEPFASDDLGKYTHCQLGYSEQQEVVHQSSDKSQHEV